MFAKDVRAVLKRKMPNCEFSDVMKAVSIDWVKLSKEKKSEYYSEARRLKICYYKKYNEWLQINGPRQECAKQIGELEARQGNSDLNWNSHGK